MRFYSPTSKMSHAGSWRDSWLCTRHDRSRRWLWRLVRLFEVQRGQSATGVAARKKIAPRRELPSRSVWTADQNLRADAEKLMSHSIDDRPPAARPELERAVVDVDQICDVAGWNDVGVAEIPKRNAR